MVVINNSIWFIQNGSELYHHGIKGQKWGIRRYQNPDGSLTPEGRRRYGNYILRRNRRNEKRWEKQDRKDEKIYTSKILNRSKIDKFQKKYIEDYKRKGMTQKEAEIAAYKKARAFKIATIAGAIAITAAASYVAYRHYDKNVDRFLKSGLELKRVSPNDSLFVHDGFYAALGKNKLDVTKYAGIYAGELQGINPNSDIFQKTIKVGSSGLRIASEKSGANALKTILKDKSSMKELSDSLKEAGFTFTFAGRANNAKVAYDAAKKLDKGIVDKTVYKGLVATMGPFRKENIDKYGTKLYSKLKSLGYDGIQDLNDKFISGYKAKMPVIILDSNKVNVSSVRKLSQDEIGKSRAIGYGHILLSNMSKSAISTGASVVAGKGIKKSIETSKNNKIVSDYRKEHPNTELSYNEIVRNYYRQK